MDVEKLLAPRAATGSGFPEDDVEIPGIGTVRVRSLSRAEVYLVDKLPDAESKERRMLSMALVDPKMSEHQVGDWMRTADFDEINPVLNKVFELSKLLPGAAKEAMVDLQTDPEARFHNVSGSEAGDDGRSA